MRKLYTELICTRHKAHDRQFRPFHTVYSGSQIKTHHTVPNRRTEFWTGVRQNYLSSLAWYRLASSLACSGLPAGYRPSKPYSIVCSVWWRKPGCVCPTLGWRCTGANSWGISISDQSAARAIQRFHGPLLTDLTAKMAHTAGLSSDRRSLRCLDQPLYKRTGQSLSALPSAWHRADPVGMLADSHDNRGGVRRNNPRFVVSWLCHPANLYRDRRPCHSQTHRCRRLPYRGNIVDSRPTSSLEKLDYFISRRRHPSWMGTFMTAGGPANDRHDDYCARRPCDPLCHVLGYCTQSTPRWLQVLSFVPVAVLTAIIVPAVIIAPDGGLEFAANARLPAALIAVTMALLTRSVVITIGTGLAALWVLDWLVY